LVATKCTPVIRSFYLRLRGVGKAPKVALVACMRKRLTILNAMLKHRSGPGNLNKPISGESATVDGPTGR
jgi:hypothetical protein